MQPERDAVYVAFGSNLGDRLQNTRAALGRLREIAIIIAVAGLYETAPAGPQNQPPFYNTACALRTPLSPRALLREVKRIEWELGRRPSRAWGPRPIDIDILLAGSARIDDATMTVPHPHLAERGFVLAPLAEIAAAVTHPLTGRSIRQLLDDLPPARLDGVVRIAGPDWVLSGA